MKLSLLLAGLLLVGCAVSAEPEPTPSQPTYGTMPTRPAPTNTGTPDPTPPTSTCVVVDDWINGCEVIKVYCDNTLKDLEIRCTNGNIVFPWQYLPDPPPPWVDRGSNSDRK